MDKILAAAKFIATARRSRAPLAALPADCIPANEADAYTVKRALDSGVKLAASDYVRVGVECEIAVKLARDLLPPEQPFTAEWMGEAVEAYYPAIEIVDDRYVKWETAGAPTLVADDFFAAGCVLRQ